MCKVQPLLSKPNNEFNHVFPELVVIYLNLEAPTRNSLLLHVSITQC